MEFLKIQAYEPHFTVIMGFSQSKFRNKYPHIYHSMIVTAIGFKFTYHKLVLQYFGWQSYRRPSDDIFHVTNYKISKYPYFYQCLSLNRIANISFPLYTEIWCLIILNESQSTAFQVKYLLTSIFQYKIRLMQVLFIVVLKKSKVHRVSSKLASISK